jgi:hypothetical protein
MPEPPATAAAAPAASPPAAPAPPVPPPAVRPARKAGGDDRETARRRRRIKTLEERIAGIEREIEAIEARLWEDESPPGPVESTRLLDAKRERQAELDALVEEWAGLAEQEERPQPSPRN